MTAIGDSGTANGVAFNSPMVAWTLQGGHRGPQQGTVPAKKSFIRTEPSNIVVTSVKQSEDGTGTVIRLYEAEGDRCTARISLLKPIREAYRTSLLEYDPERLAVDAGGTLTLPVKPWEIVTILIKE